MLTARLLCLYLAKWHMWKLSNNCYSSWYISRVYIANFITLARTATEIWYDLSSSALP